MPQVIHVGYYCEKCQKFVLTTLDMFEHPDLGMTTCWICRKCGHMVHLKRQEVNYAV